MKRLAPFVALSLLLVLWCAGASEAQIFGCEGVPFNGSITLGDATQFGRFTRNGVPTTCATSATCVLPLAGTYHYRLHTFRNYGAVPACVTVNVNTACAGVNYIYAVGYIGGFNPGDICANNVAEVGSSPEPNATMSFNVPATTNLEIVVSEVEENAGCPAYTLTLTGCPPQPLIFNSGFEVVPLPDWSDISPRLCAGFCGLQSPALCYCDPICLTNGDCCIDACLTCGQCQF